MAQNIWCARGNQGTVPMDPLSPFHPSEHTFQGEAFANIIGTKNTLSRLPAEYRELERNDPLLRENPNRWVMFPIQHKEIEKMYKKHVASFRTAEEVDLSQDGVDWQTFTEHGQHFVEHVLAFFATSDGVVLENLANRFSIKIEMPEARAFYGFQIAMENIHSETYSLLIDQ